MVYAAILAGGKGTRMGSELPKQFLEIQGVPIAVHTVRCFLRCRAIDETAICVPAAYVDYTRELLEKYDDIGDRVSVIEGGADRTGSLENACRFFSRNREMAADDVMVTHDCVRPFVTEAMIIGSIDAARQVGGATAAVPCVDTICVSKDGAVIDSVPNRAELYSVQTPQTFMMKAFCEILYSLTDEEKARVTDASAVLRLRGRSVALSEGSPSNIKITHPGDIAVAERLAECFS